MATTRRFNALLTLLVATAACVCWSFAAHAATPSETQRKKEPPISGGGVTGLDLKTQLEKGLKARRPVEFDYIREINKLVEEKKLPRDLVASTFIWARKLPTRNLQYFQFALQARVRAKHLDVKLPDLRDQAVGVKTNGGLNGFGNFGNDPLGPTPE